MDTGLALLHSRAAAPTALDAAYDLYAVGLYDYCRWALGDDRLAADVLADALLAAVGRGVIPTGAGREPRLRRAAHQRPVDGEPVRAWIYAVARADCNARRGAAVVIEGGGSRSTDRDFPIPQLSLTDQRQLTRLRQSLDRLGPEEQEIAELAFRHNFSAPAIAAVLGRRLRPIRSTVAEIYGHLSSWCMDGVAVAFAVPPFAAPPPTLRRTVLEAAAAGSRPNRLAAGHAPYDRLGFPTRGRRRGLLAATAVTTGIAGIAALGIAAVASNDLALPSALTASSDIRSVSTSLNVTFDPATNAWDARVTAIAEGFDAAEVRTAVWWTDATGVQRREAVSVQIGPDTYAADVKGLPSGPFACAQTIAIAATGEAVLGPVTGPGPTAAGCPPALPERLAELGF